VEVHIKTEIIEKYREATNKLLLLDYDGTLVDYTNIPDNAIPSEHLLSILLRLVGEQHTKIIIISGRSHLEIDRLLGHLPLTIIAEHGAMIKENGVWTNQVAENFTWKKEIISIFNQVTLKCPGSYVEEKSFSVTWHYRNAGSLSGEINSRELISLAGKVIPIYGLKILDGNKVVEIMPGEIGKGIAVKKILEHEKFDYILSVGDDATDEEVFEIFRTETNSFTIKVGDGSTFAKYNFDTFNDVILLLKQLSG
jgi:trehalose 6-phosphate synthase/phosphatase